MAYQHGNIFNSLPIVAAAIGDKCGVSIKIGGDTARTNGKVIELPNPVDYNRDVLLGFIIHEAGHIRFSDFSGTFCKKLKTQFQKTLNNAFEDVRVEREMRELYAGANSFLAATFEHVDKKFQMTKDCDQDNELGVFLQFVVSNCWANYRLLPNLDEWTQRSEKNAQRIFPQRILQKVKAVNAKILNAKKEEDCLSMANEIIEIIKQFSQEVLLEDFSDGEDGDPQSGEIQGLQAMQGSSGNGQGQQAQASQNQGQGQNGQASDGSNPQQGSDTGNDSQQGSDEGQSSKEKSSGGGQGSQSKTAAQSTQSKGNQGKAGNGQQSQEKPVSSSASGRSDGQKDQKGKDEGDASGSKAKAEKRENPLSNFSQDDIDNFSDEGQFDIANQVKNELDKAKKHEDSSSSSKKKGEWTPNRVVGSDSVGKANANNRSKTIVEEARKAALTLKRQLEGLVQEAARTQIRTVNTGQNIARSKLSRLHSWNTRVFTRKTEHQSTNSAVHVLLDLSGSMDKSQLTAIKAATAMVMALENLPNTNVGFTVFPASACMSMTNHTARSVSVIKHSERINATNVARFGTLFASGGTPLTQALEDVTMSLARQKQPRKIVIVVTDGEPNDTRSARNFIQRMEMSGIELFGIGINYQISHLFKHSKMIQKVEDLKGVLFELAKKTSLTGFQ